MSANDIVFHVEQTAFLTLREAASEMRLSIRTLRRLVAAGDVRAVRFSPRGNLRIPRRELEAFIEDQQEAEAGVS